MRTSNLSNTLPAPLLALASQSGLYRVIVTGNDLAPRYRHQDEAFIMPAIGRNPADIETGTIVLVAIADEGKPDFFSRTGMYTLNADGDLIAGKTVIAQGSYIVLGIATP